MADAESLRDPRRAIPAADRLLGDPSFAVLLASSSRERVVAALQLVQARLRLAFADHETGAADLSPAWFATRVAEALEQGRRPTLLPVLNATGVILHTNLGRAPLAPAALAAMQAAAAGYSTLEYDRDTGTRGSRYHHCVSLLRELTGAEDALVVNNNAAAVVLALNTLAAGRRVVVSRGELVEIGGGFRVPEIMERSGCRMIEVGATNRTHLHDYEAAIDAETALLLKVHRSNFRMTGFVAEVSPARLAELARNHQLPLLHDLGSGLLLPAETLGLPAEPSVRDAIVEGADLVAFSGDKLLGGPQAGILVGRAEAIARCRENPLCRALRVDKLTVAGMAATLALYLDPERARRDIPVLRMLTMSQEQLESRARGWVARLTVQGIAADVIPGESAVGGGALPEVTLPTMLVRLRPAAGAAALERALRLGEPPVIVRVQDDAVLLDPRTLPEADEPSLFDALGRALSA